MAKISMAKVVAALNVPRESVTEFIVVVDGSELRITQDCDLYIYELPSQGRPGRPWVCSLVRLAG
jgi:hypothetical protein